MGWERKKGQATQRKWEEQKPTWSEGATYIKSFQAGAKAQGWDLAWHVQGTVRMPVWLEQSEHWGEGGKS